MRVRRCAQDEQERSLHRARTVATVTGRITTRAGRKIRHVAPYAPPVYYGCAQLPTRECAAQLVRNFVDGGSPELREAVTERIATTGDCVLHAVHVVTGKPCFCTTCRPDIKRFA
jgi:hypothetical protein